MMRRTLADIVRVYRRDWLLLVATQLVTGLALGIIVWGLLWVATQAAQSLIGWLTVDGGLSPGPATLFGLAAAALFVLVALPMLICAVVVAIGITDDELSGRRIAPFRWAVTGFGLAPTVTATIGLGCAVLVALFVGAPVIFALAVAALVGTPFVRLIRRRRPGFLGAWPSVRVLVFCLIPFALAAYWSARVLLALPVAVLEHRGVIDSLRAADRLARSRRLLVVVLLVVAWLIPVLAGAALSLLGFLAWADTGAQIGQVVSQLVLSSLPLVVLTVIYRGAAGSITQARAQAPARDRRRVLALNPALLRRVATIMPAVLLITGVGVAQVLPASSAAAASGAPVVLTVTSNSDSTDATTLATQQQNCLNGSGDCTLRAALEAAEALSVSGTTGEILVNFAGDTTVLVAGSPLTFDNSNVSGGETLPGELPPGETPPGETPVIMGTLTIDGLGHAVTLDGGGTTQVLSLFSRSWDVVVRGLELRNGYVAGPGGALYLGGTRSALVDTVSLHDSRAIAGGGLYAGTNTTVRNSTFTNNSLAPADGSTVPGGADLFSGASVTAVNNTFAGSQGGIIYNWGSIGHTLSLNNSLIAVSAYDSQGQFNCSGGGITGVSNVVSDGANGCPGLIPSASVFLGPLTRVAPGFPPVRPLLSNTTAAMGASMAECPPTDARGLARAATGCDVGAYEFSPATTTALSSWPNPAEYGDEILLTATMTAQHEQSVSVVGSVQFVVDGVDFGAPVEIYAGAARHGFTPAAAGNYAITAEFTPGVPGFEGSTAPALAQVVTVSGTPVLLQSNRPSAMLGDPVEFTVTVGDGPQQITGEVSLLDITDGAGVVVDTVVLGGSHTVTITTSGLAAGARTLVADYAGDANNAAGRSTAVAVSMLSPSSTTIETDVATAVFGSPVVVTAAVTGTGTGPTPSGTVTFASEGVVLGSALLENGSAEVVVSALGAGAHEIIARFEGDGFYAPSDSAGATIAISPASTSTTLADPGSVIFGHPTVLTATVTNTASGSTADPSGEVTFAAGGRELGSATLVGNADGTSTASYTTVVGDLASGVVAVQASFVTGTTDNFASSTSAQGVAIVAAASTSVELQSDVTPSPFGSPIQFTATVSATGGSLATPTGTVRFTAGSAVLGTATLIGGVATMSYSGLARGVYTIEAEYLGTLELGQSSGEFQQIVSTDATTTALVPSLTTSVHGQPVSFAISVVGSGGGLPDGTVILRDGTTDIATVPLVAGAASVTLADLGAGTHRLHAVFAGDGNYLASEGQGEVTVTAAATATALQLSTTDSVIGEAVTLSATVSTADALSTRAPRGSVRFSYYGLELGTVPLTIADGLSSTVTLVTTALPQTSAYPRSEIDITAEFVPDVADFSGSTDVQAIRVAPGTTEISLAVTPGTVGTDAIAIATITVTRGVGVPTGTVRFIAADTIVDVPVVNGTAVSPGLRLPRGQRNVMAVYTSGDSNFLAGVPDGSDRTGVRVDTGAGLPAIELTRSTTGAIAFGTPNTLTATIAVGGTDATGPVTFVAVGPQGTTLLGSALPIGATAQLTTTAIPVGTQLLTASYAGDYNYSAASSSSLTQIVVAATTTTTVTASREPSRVLVPVGYSATVRAAAGAIPSGTVVFTVDGTVLASSALDTAGVASATSTPQAHGDAQVVATFTPSDGSVTGSTGTLTHVVDGLPTTVALASSNYKTGIGESVTYRLSVIPTDYQLVTNARPTGTVVIGDGAGTECEAELSMAGSQPGEAVAECSLSWNAGGDHIVTVVYPGDSIYAGGTPPGQFIDVTKSAPDIILTASTDRAWVGGETTRLFWSVRGPVADGTVLSITRLGQTVCTSTALEGSCDYAFPRNFSGATSFTLVYPGNAAWSAESAQLDQNVTECIRFSDPTVTPVGAGTATADAAPNCAGGTGYIPGTVVQYSVTPNPGYIFDSWSRGSTLVATAGSGVNNRANFHVDCVTVRYSTLGTASPGGQMRVSPKPNCGPLPQAWSYEAGGVTVGKYSPGTVLTLEATVPSDPAKPMRLYKWLGLGAGEDAVSATTTITLAADKPRSIYASFGIVCNRNVTFPAPQNGTATIGAPNCTDPDGDGYAPGSTVPVSTTATNSAFFSGWVAPEHLLSSIRSSATGSSASLLIPTSPVRLGVDYGSCVRITLAVEGHNARNDMFGTATASPSGNCPTLGEGWYTPGTYVSLTAKTALRGATFMSWAGLPDRRSRRSADTGLRVEESATYTARFADLQQCSTLSMKSVPAEAFDLSVSFPDGDDTCPSGQYNRFLGKHHHGTTLVRVTATPKTAAAATAMGGWTAATHLLESAEGATSASNLSSRGLTADLLIYGDSQLTAWSCVAINPTLTLVSPNGTAHTTRAPSDADFINVDPAPNCGFSSMAYTTGSSVSVLANGPVEGYAFDGWTGALTSPDEYPATPLVLDGSARSVPITANYTVICHALTTNFDNVAISPEPNCPDSLASEHSYIGGTSVALEATGDGGLVFRGWNGPTVFTEGTIAGTNMTADVALYANYTSKSVGERITDVATTVGDALAITMKKVTGVAAAIVTGLVTGGNPVTAALGLVVLLGQAVGGVADLLGVDSAGLRSFQSVVAGVAATMSFLTSITTCATAWSATADGGPPSDDTSAQEVIGDGYGAYETLTNGAGKPPPTTNLGQAKKLGARLGAVVGVGVGVYQMATAGPGTGWDSSAESAWTTGGDVYMDCYARSIPSYFGLPPVPAGGTGGR